MKFKRPFLDSLSFEVRYAHGHLYLDRCGQTMVDIEKRYEGWAPGQIDVNSGAIEKFDDNFNVQFNVNRYNFFAMFPPVVSWGDLYPPEDSGRSRAPKSPELRSASAWSPGPDMARSAR